MKDPDKTRIHIDFETYCELDIKKCGHHTYCRHESFEILCMAYKIDDRPTQIVDFSETAYVPYSLVELLEDDDTIIVAHNASFEMECIYSRDGSVKFYGFAPEPSKFICTAAKAAYHALPRHLSGVTSALNLSRKDLEAQKAMLYFCQPIKTGKLKGTKPTKDMDLEKWQIMLDYCVKDVEAEYAVDNYLDDLPEEEQNLWEFDTYMNNFGVAYDRPLAEKIITFGSKIKDGVIEKCKEITGGIAPTQQKELLNWCNSKLDNTIEDVTAGTVKALLKQDIPKDVSIVLRCRQLASKTSLAKYDKMLDADSGDNILRGMFLYHGATTGRWSGRLVQLHNLPRGIKLDPIDGAEFVRNCSDLEFLKLMYPDPISAFSTLIRPTMVAREGKIFYIADYTGIEARVLGWMADESNYQDAFKSNKDLYKVQASHIYSVPYDKVTSDQRQLGKAAVLGLGYQMGLNTFINTVKSWGMDVPDELLENALNSYRESNPNIKAMWGRLEKAAVNCVATGKPYKTCRVMFHMSEDGMFLKCRLPSGRDLHYPKPSLKIRETGWGEKKRQLHFWTTVNGAFVESSSYGGKLTENVVQAVARDLLREGLFAIDADGRWDIVGHVHDEIIAEGDVGESLEDFEALMAQTPKWANGCIYGTDGFVSPRYKK